MGIFRPRHIIKFPLVNSLLSIPSYQSIKVAAFMPNTEIRPRWLPVIHPRERYEIGICVTLDILQQDVDTMAHMEPTHFVLGIIHSRRMVAWVSRKGSFPNEVQTVDLL